ncbi:MAG: TetR/AcrR family transcriptional regulator [Pseudomonadota bacterium]
MKPPKTSTGTQQQSASPDLPFSLCPVSAGRPRAADAEARMHNLLSTAGRLFLEKGYNKVSLEMIAKEAHVAVRTIYVKFGGKAGLFAAVISTGRQHFFATMDDLDTSMRPMREILFDFCVRFRDLVQSPGGINLHRMVIAEAQSSPELAIAFNAVGPQQTREILLRFFSRPDIRVQLRDDIPLAMLPVHLLNCILGDQLSRYLIEPETPPSAEETRQQVAYGLDLFLHGTLRPAAD